MGREEQQLTDAINMAAAVHYAQFDKAGMPYILHPLHLMNFFMDDMELAAIAVLHDVVEDGDNISLETLRVMGMSPRVVEAVDYLTHAKGVSYDDYIERMAHNLDAVRVKIRDLQHNADNTRLKKITDKDIARREKYIKAHSRLMGIDS